MDSVISIIIPIYNRIKITKEGIKYIHSAVQYYENSAAPTYKIEVIIVDDGSTDGSGDWLKKNYTTYKVLSGDGTLWWTGAVNLGIQYSLDTFKNLHGVILQNDDVMVDEMWLANLLRDTDAHPNSLIGCATALQDEKDLLQYGGRDIHPWFAKEVKTNFKAARNQFEEGHVIPSFDLYGRGLYIPVEVFERIGLFDQKSFKHRGDMDIPLRAKKIGFNLLISYDAIVYELPQLTFALDVKTKLTVKEAYKLLTDFRSSSNFKFIYNYSRIATNNSLQFLVFLLSNFFYHTRGILWRLLRQYVYLIKSY